MSMRRHWNEMAKTNCMNSIAYSWNKSDKQFRASGMICAANLLVFLLRYKNQWDSMKVLDLGCGIGRVTEFLDIPFKQVIGIDISPEMIKKAKKRHPDIDFYVKTKSLSVLGNNSFDLVYSFVVLQHCERNAVKQYFKEVSQILKPKGLFVFQIPISDKNIDDPISYQAVRYWKTKDIKQLAKDNNFIIEKFDSSDRHNLQLFIKQ